jgi:hypothetical protein
LKALFKSAPATLVSKKSETEFDLSDSRHSNLGPKMKSTSATLVPMLVADERRALKQVSKIKLKFEGGSSCGLSSSAGRTFELAGAGRARGFKFLRVVDAVPRAEWGDGDDLMEGVGPAAAPSFTHSDSEGAAAPDSSS